MLYKIFTSSLSTFSSLPFYCGAIGDFLLSSCQHFLYIIFGTYSSCMGTNTISFFGARTKTWTMGVPTPTLKPFGAHPSYFSFFTLTIHTHSKLMSYYVLNHRYVT
jgi:hypothetical protein